MWMYASELLLFAVMLILFSNSNGQLPSGTQSTNMFGLLPFGNDTDDLFGPSTLDGPSPPLTLREPFIFFGKQYREIVVNSNGVLSLGNTGFSQFRTRPFPFHSPPLIAPFWADFDPRVEGHISYRQTNDSALLQVIHLLVMDLDDEDFVSFVPTNLFIATWDKVPPFAHRGEEEYNTFQVVLATDATLTVAVFIYEDIQWERSTQIGFNFGDEEHSLTIPETYSDQILNISQLTNVGEPGVFIFRLDNIDMVDCSTSIGCMTSDLGMMLSGECCINTPEGLAYTKPGSNTCYVCIVLGWLNDSFTGIEQEESYVIKVGYRKGAEQVEFNIIFDVVQEVQPSFFGRGSSDVLVNPEVVQIIPGIPPISVEVTFLADDVALEPDEMITLELVPSVQVSLLSGEGVFFQKTVILTIIDKDVIDVYFLRENYLATESDGSMEVSVCINKPVSFPAYIRVSTEILLNQSASNTLSVVPTDSPLSPSRADLQDFESLPFNYNLYFFQDENSFDQSDNCKSISVLIINDAVNEADEVFMIQLNSVALSRLPFYPIDPEILMSRNISLGWIIDDDPIRIGFELPSYTFLEPPFEDQVQIFLATEDNRHSEQTFQVSIELITLNSSDSQQPAAVDEDFVVSNRTITVLFPPFTQRVPYQFTLLPDDNSGETESFYVMSSNSGDDQFPMYLPPNMHTEVASIVIIDTENTIGFSQELVTIREDQGVAEITIFSYDSVTSHDDLTLNLTTFGGNATEGKDYEGFFQKLVEFGPNDSSIIIDLKIIDDNLAEGVETFLGELVVNGPTQNFSVTMKIEILDDEERGVCGNMIAKQNCSEDAFCNVLNGRILASCSCNDGFLGNGFICQDIDECDTGEDDCDANAVCSNTHGSYMCDCDEGYLGNGTLCIASTNQVPGSCYISSDHHNCTCFKRHNATSVMDCGCLPGYEITQMEGCHDINECNHSSPCGIGTCINTHGSFYCLCPVGYYFDELGCVDLNECKLGPEVHGCSMNAECMNTNGSYTCSCKHGFTGDGIICRSQECRIRNTESCGCSNGYYFEPRSRSCRDVNECEMYSSLCNKNARCVNTPGSFVCECSFGFRGDGTICKDINECDTGLHDCDENAFCNNTAGSYTCSCRPSFFGNGRDSECRMGIAPRISNREILVRPNYNLSYAIGTDFCLEDADSFPNSVFVHCPVVNSAIPLPHYHMTATLRAATDGTVIEQLLDKQTDYLNLDKTILSALFDNDTVFINITCNVHNVFGNDERTTSITVCEPTECQDGVTNNCSQTCTRSSVHTYECGCNDGYVLNMDICVDIDECVNSSTHNCSEVDHENCRNLEGSYVCDCSSGFERQGNVCEDVDECTMMTDNCTEIELCQNRPGSFTCQCKEGYKRLSESCVDIDECSSVASSCVESNHQVCINTFGSYMCDCAQGFQQDSNNICHDVNECNVFNGNCSQLCNNINGSYYCDCEDGFVLDIQNNSSCDDIDECKRELDNCHSNAICINTIGSFNCRCKSLYEGDGVTCQVSESLITGSAVGIGSFLLIAGILLVVVCSCCYIRRSLHIVTKRKFNISLPESGYLSGSILSPLISRAESNTSQHEPELRKFSVQSSYKLKLPPHLIIPSSSIKLVESVGQGEFGIVYKGRIIKGEIVTETVAIKTLKGFYNRAAVKQMLKECSKMHSFKHPNVLNLTGVCLDGGPNPYIIMPFMVNGSLLAYLKKNRGKLVVSCKDDNVDEEKSARKQLMDMCIQVAKGMKYLADEKVVHRDLAARNCMIDINFMIKVADFGLSESVGTKEYFRQDRSSNIKLPLKWLAPESMEDYVFSEKSDVWAYGVTCWEIFSGGKVPYPSVDLVNLPRLLANGYRLEKPDNDACSSEMYTFMLQCWEYDVETRPSFSSLVESLSKYLEAVADYMDFGSESLEATDTEGVGFNVGFLEEETTLEEKEEFQISMPGPVLNTCM